MARHRSHSIEFKRQVAQEFVAGETLYALAKRYDISRTLIRVWVKKLEAGALDEDAQAADLLQEYEAKIATLERMVGRQALEIEFLKGALRNAPRPRSARYFLPPLEAAAQLHRVSLVIARVHNDAEIEQVVTALGREPGGGLIVVPDGFMVVHRAAIIALAARSNVPAVYWQSLFAKDGGLLSYGPDYSDLFHRAGLYVDQILRGAKPADLPVQLPVKFEMTFNVKTAKAVGLTIPQTLLAAADEVIE